MPYDILISNKWLSLAPCQKLRTNFFLIKKKRKKMKDIDGFKFLISSCCFVCDTRIKEFVLCVNIIFTHRILGLENQ